MLQGTMGQWHGFQVSKSQRNTLRTSRYLMSPRLSLLSSSDHCFLCSARSGKNRMTILSLATSSDMGTGHSAET